VRCPGQARVAAPAQRESQAHDPALPQVLVEVGELHVDLPLRVVGVLGHVGGVYCVRVQGLSSRSKQPQAQHIAAKKTAVDSAERVQISATASADSAHDRAPLRWSIAVQPP
jgi:hypothetical protein